MTNWRTCLSADPHARGTESDDAYDLAILTGRSQLTPDNRNGRPTGYYETAR